MSLRILLPAEFQDVYRRAALAWVRRGHEFNRDEWRVAFRAFDLLKEAAVVTLRDVSPFPAIYYRHVDEPYANGFIQTLLDADEIEPAGIQAWAKVARNISPKLRKAGLVPPHQPAARLLVAYCLYWWYAFAYGYIFEVEILRDLSQSGVQFTAHDLTKRQERMSPWDLEVLGFRGDIKRSLSFLQTSRGRRLPYAFYIVRLTRADRSRTLVVIMCRAMWAAIDGETVLATLDSLANALPDTARVSISDVKVIVADYETWKRMVRQRQSERQLEGE
ncbi:MAG: hypothetical protein ISS49_17350 [Anaerolineae bacterium]|nr:hypothetical protein [Anaerolineae bacterium]